jgi:hypothetical protein
MENAFALRQIACYKSFGNQFRPVMAGSPADFESSLSDLIHPSCPGLDSERCRQSTFKITRLQVTVIMIGFQRLLQARACPRTSGESVLASDNVTVSSQDPL